VALQANARHIPVAGWQRAIRMTLGSKPLL
jgi:hypothetical protein